MGYNKHNIILVMYSDIKKAVVKRVTTMYSQQQGLIKCSLNNIIRKESTMSSLKT